MKKNLKWFMMAIVTLVMGVSFVSCGDDDDPDTPPTKTATEAYLEKGIYVSDNTLQYFDVVVTDNEGNTTNITSENTTIVTDTVFGDYHDRYKLFFTEKNCNSTNNRLRLWKSDKQTLKNFPVTKEFVVTVTKKEGVRPADEEKVDVICIPDVEINNNKGEFEYCDVKAVYSILGGIPGKNWDKVTVFTHTSTLTFTKADNVSGSVNK